MNEEHMAKSELFSFLDATGGLDAGFEISINGSDPIFGKISARSKASAIVHYVDYRRISRASKLECVELKRFLCKTGNGSLDKVLGWICEWRDGNLEEGVEF